MEEIGERLRRIRYEVKLKQGEFAKRIEISQSMLSGIESGREVLTDRNIKLICLEFGVNELWLRSGDGQIFVSELTFTPILSLDGEKLNREETEFIEIYRKLIPPNKTAAKTMVSALLKAQDLTKNGRGFTP